MRFNACDKRLRVVWRNGQRFPVMPRNQRNGGREMRVDDRQARGHRLDLDNPERLGFGDGGKCKDLRGMEESLDLVAGQATGKTDSIGDAEPGGQLLQVREQRTFADDGGVAIDGLHRADQHIVPLVANKTAERHDVARLLAPDLRP